MMAGYSLLSLTGYAILMWLFLAVIYDGVFLISLVMFNEYPLDKFALLTTMFRPSTFAGIGNARKALRAAEPLLHGVPGWALLVLVAGLTALCFGRWLVHERAASLTASGGSPSPPLPGTLSWR